MGGCVNMGGRGAVSRSGSVLVMSEQEYLDRAGVGSPMSDYMVDKVKLRNGSTLRQREAMEREASKARDDYASRRSAARAEYAEKVKRGELRRLPESKPLCALPKGILTIRAFNRRGRRSRSEAMTGALERGFDGWTRGIERYEQGRKCLQQLIPYPLYIGQC